MVEIYWLTYDIFFLKCHDRISEAEAREGGERAPDAEDDEVGRQLLQQEARVGAHTVP